MNKIIDEFKNFTKNPLSNCGVTVGLVDNDYRLWAITLIGPKDSSYSGGLFKINIKFPEDYPLKPPEVYYVTPIYHLNINPRAPRSSEDLPLGYVSLSTLSWWKPEYTVREILINTFALFYKANPESPFGLDRAEEFLENRAVYDEKVKHFTKKYASPFRKYIEDKTKDWDFEI